MIIDDIHRGIVKYRPRKRIGRGIGSGHGKTSGRGHKGQHSRNGVSFLPIFQGGAMPLVRRIPKRGFFNRFADKITVVNVSDLEQNFESGDEVTVEVLVKKNLARGHFDQVKILGNGEISKKLKVSAHRFSKSAAEKITQAGGEVVVLPGKAPVVKNKQGTRKKQQRSS